MFGWGRNGLFPAGGASSIAEEPWLYRLLAFDSVARTAAATADPGGPEGRNVKGHLVRAFDRAGDGLTRGNVIVVAAPGVAAAMRRVSGFG